MAWSELDICSVGSFKRHIPYIGRLTFDFREKIKKVTGYSKIPFVPEIIGTAITFYIVCMTWIFFRAKTFGDAFYIIRQLTTFIPDFSIVPGSFNNIPSSRLIISVGAIVILIRCGISSAAVPTLKQQ